MKSPCAVLPGWVVNAVILALGCLAPLNSSGGALENYVSAPDTTHSWKRLKQSTEGGFTVTQLEMTSQTWREHVWTHRMQIVQPEKMRNKDIAFLFITGDGDGASSVPMLRLLAERAGALAAVVTRVPNQPLYDGKKEDALIAHTFDQFMKTGDETWPLLFPMAKSAVRALDTVQAFAEKELGQKVERFVVGGASKRGWTTWLAAAVDNRIKGIAPMVIDMLNMKKQMEWSEKRYGKQSEQIRDYTDLSLHLRLDDPRMVQLRGWVDPYSYRERYNIPKLLLLGTNDPYWTVDALQHYWGDLPEPKLVFQTPNAGHNLGDRKDAIQTLAAFFQTISDGQPLPKMTWDFKAGRPAEVSVAVQPAAKSFRLLTADSRDRDFRDDVWTSRVLQNSPSDRANASIKSPTNGYRASLVEATLTSSTGHEYKLSTEARVVPNDIK